MFHFITPLYRYNNIKIVYSTIMHQTSNFKWHLIEGDNHTGEETLDFLKQDSRVIRYKIKTYHVWGHEQRNYFITDIGGNDRDWCYFLDDDNVVTPDLVNTCNEYENTCIDFVLFSQKAGLTEKTRLYGDGPHRLNLGTFDIGSPAIRFSLIKKTYIYNVGYRNGDGHYALDIAKFNGEHVFQFCPDKFVRYNSLSLEII